MDSDQKREEANEKEKSGRKRDMNAKMNGNIALRRRLFGSWKTVHRLIYLPSTAYPTKMLIAVEVTIWHPREHQAHRRPVDGRCTRSNLNVTPEMSIVKGVASNLSNP